MKEYFDTKALDNNEYETLLIELLASMFYLPAEVLNDKATKIKHFVILSGEEAQSVLEDIEQGTNARLVCIKGDISRHNLHYAKQVAISERSYKGLRFFIYKLWHPAHPKAPKPNSNPNLESSNGITE